MSSHQQEIVTVPLKSLNLDISNPRFATAGSSQTEAIQQLFDTSKILELAEEILKLGYFDNEQPIALATDGKYTILEGNRRVCCLKTLNDPDLTPDSHRTKLKRLLNRYATEAESLPTHIRVMLVKSREEATPHIARLHTMASKEKWTTDQQAAFYYNQYLAGRSIEVLRTTGGQRITRLFRIATMRRLIQAIDLTDATLREYTKSKHLKTSILEYVCLRRRIQEVIGIEFSNTGFVRLQGDVRTEPAPEEVAKSLTASQIDVLSYIISLIRREKLNTRSPELNEQRREFPEFINTLATIRASQESRAEDSQYPQEPPLTPNPNTNSADDTDDNGPGAHEPSTPLPDDSSETQNERKSRGSGPKDPRTYKYLPFEGIEVASVPTPLRLRYLELMRIDIEKFPFSAACLMRSLFESQIKAIAPAYFDETISNEEKGLTEHKSESETRTAKSARRKLENLRKLKKQGGQLNEYFQYCCKGRYEEIKTLQPLLNKIDRKDPNIPGTITWFNMVLHNHEFTITKNEVHNAWLLISPLIRHMIDTEYRK